MKSSSSSRPQGFTLLETVIAIGVLAVLLTGFMVVFTPAAEGIRKSINVQQADRLASALEQELVTLRKGDESADIVTGFDKAFDRIRRSATANEALLVYQYRGKPSGLRADGTPEPVVSMKGKIPGKDFIVVPMVRKAKDTLFSDPTTGDIAAIEGAVYLIKCTQLIYENGTSGGLKLGVPGEIVDPKGTDDSKYTKTDTYPEAVVAFSADFYIMPAKTSSYFSGNAFKSKFETLKNPVFSRNLAVRR
ncbi:MAG: type II secretion system protein [Verrucomicrobiota bacterium]